MDFHAAFEDTMAMFPGLEGIIFVDPDGEAILHEARGIDDFEVKLTGARVPILMQHFQFVGIDQESNYMEMCFRRRYMLTVVLDQNYSITAIGKQVRERGRLRHHLTKLAVSFNEEIV